MTTQTAWSEFNRHPGHVITALDKTLYNDYQCLWFKTSNKFSRQEFEEIYKNIGSLKTPKQVRNADSLNTVITVVKNKCRPFNSLGLKLSADRRIDLRLQQ